MLGYQKNNTWNSPAKLALIGVMLLLSSTLVAFAQDRTPKRGFQPASSYALGDFESINTTNGNLLFNIPLASLPAGRGGMSAKINLIYNSKIWDPSPGFVPDTYSNTIVPRTWLLPSKTGNWRYGLEYKIELIDRVEQYRYSAQKPQCPSTEAAYPYKLKISLPDGSSHEMTPQGYESSPYTSTAGDGYYKVMPDGYMIRCNCSYPYGQTMCTTEEVSLTSNRMIYYSTDGSYLRLEFEHDNDTAEYNNPWTLYLPNGTRVTGNSINEFGIRSQRIYDRNDNYIDVQINTSHNSHRADKIVDQLNRSVIIEYDCAQNQDCVYTTGFNNEPLMWVVKWKNVGVHKTYSPSDYGGTSMNLDVNLKVVDQIILPAQAGNLSYTFDYNRGTSSPTNGWGEVSSITLPSGAKANYTYKYDGDNGLIWKDVLKNAPQQKDLIYQLEYDGSSTSTTQTWHYYNHSTSSQVTGPDGGTVSELFYHLETPGQFAGLAYWTELSDGTVIERNWQHNTPYGAPGANPYVKTEYVSIRDASGTLVKTAVKDYNYDKNGNVTSVAEYDWVPYSSLRNEEDKPTGVPGQEYLKRVTTNTYYHPTPNASSNANAPNVYIYHGTERLHSLLATSEINSGAGQVLSRTELSYDDIYLKGNLTEQRSWDSIKGAHSSPLTTDNSISVSHQYDVYGNPTLSTDARGVQTKFTYGSVGGYPDLYPTETISAYGTSMARTSSQVYDFPTGLITSVTDVDNNVTNETDYDNLGRPIEVRTAANVANLKTVTRTEYSDLDRRVITRSDLNVAYDGKLVSVQHYDQLGHVRLSRQLEDSTQSAADETTGIKVQTRYQTDVANHFNYQLVSNPYRAARSSEAGAEATMGWTRSKTDKGGRMIESETFSGNNLPAPWGANTNSTGAVVTTYDANYTTVTDQAGKARRSMTDGLGRLVRVDEPNANNDLGTVGAPAQQTSYTYDALGNLTQVNQGVQTRTFSYSSLSRLTSATNPEAHNQQGVAIPITYQYDNNGNLTLKVDARNITTTYAYDELNRVTSRTYQNDNDLTPDVYYKYDSQSLPNNAPAFDRGPSAGRLVAVLYGGINSTTGTYQGYDALGRVKRGIQRTNDGQIDQTYTFANYDYDLAGNLTSQTYPSGKVVVTEYDNAGRLAGVKKQGGNYYAGAAPTNPDDPNRILYMAHGAIKDMRLGNGLWEHTEFNNRLQLTEIRLGTTQGGVDRLKLEYGYGAAGTNNGNVQTQIIAVPAVGTAPSFTTTQTYEYDALNRLLWAKEMNGSTQAWKQSYWYDRFGNRRFNETPGATTLPAIDPNNSNATNPAISELNNQLSGTGYVYDAAGNLKCDPVNPCHATTGAAYYEYDAENKMVRSGGGANIYNTTSASYFYDGEGRRVKMAVGNTTNVFVYNAIGQVVAEYSNQTSGGSSGISFLTADNLGSTRVVTGSDKQVKSRHDYLPFGEEINLSVVTNSGRDPAQAYNLGNVRQKFTSQIRDIETGLDYFNARYYSPAHGRFTSVDPENADAELEVPQSWNAYTYARSNPQFYTDPSGKEVTICDADGKKCDYRYRDRHFSQMRAACEQSRDCQIIDDGVTRGRILHNGVVTATFYNDLDGTMGEQLVTGLHLRADAGTSIMKWSTLLAIPAPIIRLGLLGAGTTTLGLREAEKRLARKTLKQVANELGYSPSKSVKDAVSGKGPLSSISRSEREIAAKFYERAAKEVVKGPKANEARALNLARAKFLREGGAPPINIHNF